MRTWPTWLPPVAVAGEGLQQHLTVVAVAAVKQLLELLGAGVYEPPPKHSVRPVARVLRGSAGPDLAVGASRRTGWLGTKEGQDGQHAAVLVGRLGQAELLKDLG
jgi:hypothetical protein